MEKYKRIAKDIRLYHLLNAIWIGAVFGIMVFAVIAISSQQHQWLTALEVIGCTTAALIILSLILSTAACTKIRKRIQSCSGTESMESETFTPAAKQLSYGTDWLVYHTNNKYLFWTKKNIKNITVLPNKDRTKAEIRIYSTMHPEGESLRTTGTTENSLQELLNWVG